MTPAEPGQAELFGPEVREAVSRYLESASEAHIGQVFGSRAVAEEAAASGARADRAVPTLDERRQVIRQEPKSWVDIRGKRLASPQDVRDVIGPFRQPRTEIFHWPLTDDAGTVLATTMETSGAIDRVQWAEEQFPRLLSELERRAGRVGATEIHAVHNHPGGNSKPSGGDLAWTVGFRDRMDRAGSRLRLRHWVIDNDNVSEIVLDLPDAPGTVSGLVDDAVDQMLARAKTTQEALSPEQLQSVREEAYQRLASRYAKRVKHKVTPPRAGRPDWTEQGANILRDPQDAVDLAGRPLAGRVDVLYRASNGAIVAAVSHSLDAARHPERWLEAEVRAMGALDGVFVLDARPRSVYHQVHEAAKAYRGRTKILDVVGFGGEGLPAVSAQGDFGYVPQPREPGLRTRQLGAEPPPYRVRGAAPAVRARATAQAARVGETPPPSPPAETGRVAQEPPEYRPALTPLRRWLDAVREGRAFTGRPEGQRPASREAAVAAPDIGEGGRPTEALPTDVTVGGTTWTLQPISPVELVRMAHELLAGSKIFLRKYPIALGMFYGEAGDPRIGLHPKLGRDYEQFARTLAHEVGHLVDFLPEETLKRGNILGRIASLRDYLRSTIDALPTNPSKALTPQDRKQIRRAAEAKVGARPTKDNKADLAAWQAAVSEEYGRLVQDEMDARGLIGKERVREELIAVSTWWRPIDLEQATESQRRYRESSQELYADAVSVLLNSPGSLQARAPTFFESFLGYLKRKPEVREVYQDIQRLLGDEDAIMRARREELEADFQLGEAIRQAAEQRRQRQPLSNYLRQLFLTRTAPATAAESRKLGRGVAPWSEQRGVKLALQEFNHGDNVNRLLLMDLVRDVHQPLAEAGITIDQAGRYLLLRRIAEGDRGGMAEQAKAAIIDITGTDSWDAARSAYQRLEGTDQFDPELLELAESGVLNPHGYTPEEARRTIDALAKELGAEKFAQLGELMGKMRAIVSRATDEAVKLGVYSQSAYDSTILPNRETYVPFVVLDYFNGRVTAGMRHQIGTVKGVANPYVSAILKAMSLNRLNEYQRAKLALLSILDQFPDVGPERVIDRYHREQRPAGGRANLTYHKDGKFHYREVDEYLVRVLEKSDLGAVQRFTAALGSKTYQFFHPLYVTWSVAWQMRNLPRDWKRTYKTLAVAHAGKPSYRQAVEMFLDVGRFGRALSETFGAAYRHARRRDPALIRLMLQDRALGRAFHSFEPLPTSETVNQLAQRYGIVEPPIEPAGRRVRQALGAGGLKGAARGAAEVARIAAEGARRVLRPLETVGVMQETWTKAAAYKLLGRLGISGRERAYMVRNYSGTPDSTDAGLASEAVNALFMYANVISAGWRADFEVATNPRTASGYWMRAVLIDFLPKLIMAAAALGWLGEEYKEWMAHVPQYEKEKYLIVPLPPFYAATPDGGRKAIYLRIPHDDVNRVLAAVTWAFAMDDRPYAPSRAVGTVAGEFPGINPGIELPVQWIQFMSNRNPYDAFRGRDVVPQTEWEAGGWPRTREMLRYTWGEFGIVSQATDWAGAATGYSMQADEPAAGERTIRAIPGISALVKVSDRGLTEDAWSEVAWERQQRAELRASLSEAVRRTSKERQRLNTLGEDRLNTRDRKRRNQLNTWYRRYYLPLTAEMELRRDARDQKGYKAVADRLNASVERIEALPPVPLRRGGPQPPRPRPPRFPRPRSPR